MTLAKWLMGTAVPLASFLSFLIQPLIGKALLPSQGGSAPTWLGVMLFFQLALMLGYALAAWLLRRPMKTQIWVMVGLMALAAFATQLPPLLLPREGSIPGILGSLIVSLLPASMLLFCIGPLLQGWWRADAKLVPYHVYSLSNLGSLSGLILYPFAIETSIRLSQQILYWRVLLVLLIAVVGGTCFVLLRYGPTPVPAPVSRRKIDWKELPTWVGLSALTCIGMLGATHHIAAEIGSSPLAWVGPFGIYLLSFSLCFAGLCREGVAKICASALPVALVGFLLTKGVAPTATTGTALVWLLLLTATCSLVGNSLLYNARPSENFEVYYLALAAGGAIGGLFSSLLAPIVFSRAVELVWVAVVILYLAAIRLVRIGGGLNKWIVATLVLSPVVGAVWKQNREIRGADEVEYRRNVYGTAMIRREPSGGLVLSNETTTHGSQLTADAESRRRPTLYYTESSGAGRMIERLQSQRNAISIGVVGLGAGTLAAYARPDDHLTFWEIDPKAIEIARNVFTFVSDSVGTVEVLERDGRKGLEESTREFDLIVIDAFSGDSIPSHLLTEEALRVYAARLAARGGMVAIHASNRYSDVYPVVFATAASMGWKALYVETEIARVGEMRDWDPTTTQYVILCQPGQVAGVVSWFPTEEEDGRVKRTILREPLQRLRAKPTWTDDRSSILDTLDLNRFLWPE